MNEQELKYLLHLLHDINDEIFEEIIQLYFDIEESKTCKDISEEAINFFKKNLNVNPVTASSILRYIQDHAINNKSNLYKIQTLYLDALKKLLSSSNNLDKLITLISLVQWDENFIKEFSQNVLKHFSDSVYRQYRKPILISLMPHNQPELLKLLSDMMLQSEAHGEFKLTPEYMLDLCYQEKTHWLVKAAEVYKNQLHDMKNVTFKINNFTKQILVMVLIELTNSDETYDLQPLVHQLTNIFSILDNYTSADDQLQYYITEVKRELTVVKFCMENNSKLLTTGMFGQVLAQSVLAVISQVCNLSKVDRYKVTRLLNTNNDFLKDLRMLHNRAHAKTPQVSILNWDNITYYSYCAITKVIDTILSASEDSCDVNETTSSLDEIKRLITSIQPLQCQIEVIENIYSCLFLRYEYFSCNEHSQGFPCGTHSDCSYFYSKKQAKTNSIKRAGVGFVCNPFITQLILHTLKYCLEKLEESGTTNSPDANMTSRMKELIKVVNYSVWKLQLVSNLSPDTGPLQLRLCLDFVEADESSDDEDCEFDVKVVKKKPKVRRRHTTPKPDAEQAMLASTVSVEDGFSLNNGNSIDFISIMLAKPNCLVALALYHNDFAKANQIIEMFDLADAEIATEVTFTEQLRHLVAKIKNIIYYRDNTPYPSKELSALSVVSTEVMSLVEGFLASNRAPNPYDIVELASRHPHLQLYSHQNAPFINSVDILLSSSLNREITYGLINVVERKLAEVRSSTDVAAVKKTNYIRFVEDIASVIFEIFGNTEKSFDYVDNACELISDCRIPIKHKEFCKMNQLAKDLRQACEDLSGIVNPNDTRDIDANFLQKYHQIFMNVVTASDKDLYNMGEVTRHSNKKTRVPYLRLCYKYCKTVSQLDQDDKNSTDSVTDSQYFAVLEKRLHNIFGNMINDKETPVTYLEPICKKLNVNLIPKLILNFCPSIALGVGKEATEITYKNLVQAVYDFTNKEENLFLDPTTNLAPLPRMPDPQCITYIVLQNWVLAHIVKKIHVSTDESNLQHSMDARTKYLNNYMELERFNITKMLFGGNKYLASLHTTIDLEKLFQYFPTLINSGKIVTCLNIIDALLERQLISSENLINFRDMVLFKLALNPNINNNWKYCQSVKSLQLKTTLTLNNMSKWSAEGAMEAVDYLRFLLKRDDLDESVFNECTSQMIKIPLYDQIATILGLSHWYCVHQRSNDDPECIIEGLMDNQQFKLCLEWADIHDMSDNIKNLIVKNLLKQIFEYTDQATPDLVRKLLSRLSVEQAMELIQEKMTKVRNVDILQVCVDFISENCIYWKQFENIKIGLMIMLELDPGMRNFFWDIIEMPLVMIEQFLMNSKLDLLSTIINKISPSLKKDSGGDNLYYNIKLIETIVISRNAVDALLRYYAEKGLDMKNPRRPSAGSHRLTDDSLLLSIDSINIEAASKPFVMPTQVPTKEQWAEDYSTDRCMLCRTSIFSMIIRRHHCRRCGRLVCHVCSRNRMQVPSYPSEVKFRVCDDCYTQTMNKKASSNNDNVAFSSVSESGGSGVTCMDWCLSTNPERNEAVRAEFSYEFTPNVTLCLSIMRMHSINLDYPRFLLDRSDEVARELSNGGDSRLLVRARRSLLLAAAELYSRTHHDNTGLAKVAEAGAAHAARCLAHAEALATLVKHQAHHLIAHHKDHPGQLVRSLLEAEKWELALEIATKSGLSRNSVLAAWGKACLKAGCFKRAREKFAHCFRSTLNVPLDVTEEYEVGKEASEAAVSRRMHGLRHSDRASSASSVQSDGRPRNNPPLLSEIIAMLEDMNYPVNQQLLQKAEALNSTNEKLTTMNAGKKKITVVEPALNIMHTLATVKKIKIGDYSDFQTGIVQPKKSLAHGLSLGLLRNNNNHTEPKPDYHKGLDPFFYKECVYYLSNYGSHVANISFYLKHSNIGQVLKYCLDNMVDKEIFTESVYMECLRKDRVSELLKAMTDMDNTLETWAEYIMHVCRTLETSKRLEALYAVQCGSGQWARAAATCALQYARPVPRNAPFVALQRRQRHLAAALAHLSHAQPHADRTNDPKSLHFHLDKATIDNLITTITRQMELCKYLASCEASGRLTEQVVEQVITIPGERSLPPDTKELRPLTLFGSTTDKIRLVAIVLAAGQTVEEGFELAFKIIKEHKLDSMNIYTHVARYLVQADRFMEVKTLAKCIRESKETAASLMSDQVLEAGAGAVVARCEARGQLHDEQCEVLVADVRSVSVRVSCYLAGRNVHDAYLLAAAHGRANDLRRVLHAAERLANDHVRSACLKRLATLHHR